MPASAPLLDHLNEPWSSKGGCGLYNLVAITAYRLQKVESSLSWLRQLIELADKFPATDHIGIESMGFCRRGRVLFCGRRVFPPRN